MTIEQLKNLGFGGSATALGFNTRNGVADLLQAAEAIWAFAPSLVIPDGQDFDLDYIKSIQQSGDLVIIPNVTQFAENGNDDAVETLEDDTMILTNKGKYKFMATFTKGLYYQRALTALEGQGRWSIGIVDKKGDLFITCDIDGGVKGFTTGMIKAAKLQVASNTVSTKSALEFQFLNRFELDEDYAVFKNENLEFDPRQVEPITQAFIKLVNAPADTDTTIVIDALVDRGRSQPIRSLSELNFLYVVNGATVAPTAILEDVNRPGRYTLTVPAIAAADESTLRFYNGTLNNSVIEISGDGLYRSNVISFTAL